MGPKFQFLRKLFPTIFFTYKTCFTTFHADWSRKMDKNFFEPIFQNFLQVIVPLWDQNFNFWKKCFRPFFSLTKHVSHFTLIKIKKSTKIFVEPIFQNFLQVIVPLWDQNFNFWKNCFRPFFSLTKHVSHFTLIKIKKSTKIFSNQFFKIFYKLLSPYGNKISIFEKTVSDNIFHLQNMFHNISRWLKPKNGQKFFRTNFSKFFTNYCPPMGPKFQFLKKVFLTIFFTYKTCFTFHVD